MKNQIKWFGGTVATSLLAVALFTSLILLGVHLYHNPTAPSPIERATKSVIEILTPDGSGSGVVVDRRGYILTCWHVIEGSPYFLVEWNGVRVPATEVAHDASLDLALVKVDYELPGVATWGRSKDLRIGDPVFAIGFPFHVTKLVRRGVVSSINYLIDYSPFIVTDAQINPGDSGGGIFNTDGALVGVPARIQTTQGLGANIGIAYTVPGDVARWFVQLHLPPTKD